MSPITAVISLGSNIDPEVNIDRALQLISERWTVLAKSQFVQTRPVGLLDQPDFLNGAVLLQVGETDTAEAMRVALREIEAALGRVRGPDKNGPRTIDLDIAVWNGRVVDEDFYEREFLRTAVLEVFPDLIY